MVGALRRSPGDVTPCRERSARDVQVSRVSQSALLVSPVSISKWPVSVSSSVGGRDKHTEDVSVFGPVRSINWDIH